MQTITGKFYQRKRQGSLALLGIAVIIIAIILSINAFRDLSVPQSPQEHVKQFMVPAVLFVLSFFLIAGNVRYEGACKITFENYGGKLKLTIVSNSGEKLDVQPIAKQAFYIKRVEPNPWFSASPQLWNNYWWPTWSTFLELNITTVSGLQLILCEKLRNIDNLDIPVVNTRAPYGSDYTSSDAGTLARVEEMLRDKSETEESATDKYY